MKQNKPLWFYYLCFTQLLEKGGKVKLEGHITSDIKGGPCDFFLYFSYLNSLAIPLSS
jgi:hypothetical protein